MNDRQLLDVQIDGDVLILRLDVVSISAMSDIEQIARLFRQSVQEHQPRHLVVDFSSVRFFSSQMLGLLVDVWRKLHDSGGTVAVCGINPQLTRVFRITNLDKLFSFYESVQQAVNAIRAA